MATLRYPGSKSKLKTHILREFPIDAWMHFSTLQQPSYIEPFFGSGAVGWTVLAGIPDGARVVINDKDYGIYCLWKTVRDEPDELISKVRAVTLSASLFAECKETDGFLDIDPVECGFRKLILHQMSFSGLGVKAGGPIGGADQTNKAYTINARWNVSEQIRQIQLKHRLMSRFDTVVSCQDFEKVIKEECNVPSIVYADPPYYLKGADLYKHPFSDSDHERLARVLQETNAKCIVSYDDHVEVRRLYRDWSIKQVGTTYSICKARKNHELIIKNF